MKVRDNIENYEIPDGFHLTADEEEQFASDLKDIVDALIPIRGSKLKTRKYFNSHLRYTSNVRDAEEKADLPPGIFDEDKDYTPLPGEYTWNSDLLQPALLDILKDDRYTFGFIVNYIDADLQSRGNDNVLCYRPISDGAIKFSLAFDVEEIRDKAKSILDLNERLSYLNTKLTDYKLYDGLDRDEEEWLGGPVFQALQTLIEEAKNEQQIEEKRARTKAHAQPEQNPTPPRTFKQRVKQRYVGDVLYDFSLLSLPQFGYLRMEVHGGCLSDPDANEFAFSATVRDMFANCYDTNGKLQKNDIYYDEYPRFIYALMERYSDHTKEAFATNPRMGVRLMFDWLLKTREIIEANYQSLPTLYKASDIAAKRDLRTCDSKDTWPVKLNTYTLLYRYFHYRLDTLLPMMPDSLSEIIPFNMWDDQYETLKEQYSGKLGLEFLKRAVVNVCDNRKRFFDVLVEQCMTFCSQNVAYNGTVSYEDIFRHCDEPMTALLHKYFQDYIERLQAQSDVADDIDAAILNWIVSLLRDIFETYAVNQPKVFQRCGRTPVVDIAAMRFYLDICERNVIEIAHEYSLDTEKIPLVKPKKVQKEEPQKPAVEESPAPVEDKPRVEPPKRQHSCTIDYQKLYDAWNNKAFTRTSLEEFTAAIDDADFADMMMKAENAGTKAGFIGGIKYIIKNLARELGEAWYEIACDSIDVTKNDINKLNIWTNQIKKIDISIIKSCVK